MVPKFVKFELPKDRVPFGRVAKLITWVPLLVIALLRLASTAAEMVDLVLVTGTRVGRGIPKDIMPAEVPLAVAGEVGQGGWARHMLGNIKLEAIRTTKSGDLFSAMCVLPFFVHLSARTRLFHQLQVCVQSPNENPSLVYKTYP
jgi:hypothetical protein